MMRIRVDSGCRGLSIMSWIAVFSLAAFINVVSCCDSRALAADGDDAVEESGPTLLMSYSRETFEKNPIASFMYFVPLIAPTNVDNVSSVDNDQRVGIISHTLTEKSDSFRVVGEFEILGSGFHMNTFESAGMIATHTEELEKGEALTDMLDYIKFDGEGLGVVEVKGVIRGAERTVTEVSIQFNARGHKSPVTIGLYDIKPKDVEYKYENRSNQIVARVNSLTFKRTEQKPTMGIKIASIAKAGKPAGVLGNIKGVLVNLFLEPPEVDELGNSTMLEFGEALLHKKGSFTFPKAKNIRESRVVGE